MRNHDFLLSNCYELRSVNGIVLLRQLWKGIIMFNSNTLVTSSGIIINRDIPRVGVISAYKLFDDLFEECINSGIDPTWESYRADTLARLKAEHPSLDDSDIDDLFDS